MSNMNQDSTAHAPSARFDADDDREDSTEEMTERLRAMGFTGICVDRQFEDERADFDDRRLSQWKIPDPRLTGDHAPGTRNDNDGAELVEVTPDNVFDVASEAFGQDRHTQWQDSLDQYALERRNDGFREPPKPAAQPLRAVRVERTDGAPSDWSTRRVSR